MEMKKPQWLKIRYHKGEDFGQTEAILKKFGLHTVCEEAVCPNRMECFNRKTATFMIMGRNCTRNCTFCAVEKVQVDPLDVHEPMKIAEAVKELKLKHVVITSVTRDDLPDGGADHFAQVVNHIRKLDDQVIIEVLIPDFQGDVKALSKVVKAAPHIINHNIETVSRLYDSVRPMAGYQRSLELLDNVKKQDASITTKSGIMVGLGEMQLEIVQVMKDLRRVNCNLLTIGQYLAPTKKHHPVIEYVHPEVFDRYREIGMELGFEHVASAPLVRSSYHADEAYKNKN